MIQDPAGLLQRIPELKSLCEDPGVLRAVERGDPFRVYRALFMARWLGRLRSHRQLIDALLRQRRLFARPLKSGPSLGTLNGFGMTLLGNAEPDAEDGTSIATHCFVALFAIPLLPLGAYVVRPGEGRGMSRSWTIFARVPLGALPWLYSRAMALGVIALVGLGAAQTFWASRYQDVRLINGFPESLTVEIAGLTRKVPPNGMVGLSVPVGTHTGRAVTGSGLEVDTVSLEVVSGHDVFAWNIAGAAPVFRENVPYFRNKPTASMPQTEPEVYCGRQVIALKSVDDAFVEPPSSVSMSKHQSSAVRVHVGLAQGPFDRLALCYGILARQGRLADAARFTEVAARLSNWKREPAANAVRAALEKSAEEGLRVARLAREAQPDELELHRLYQWAAEQSGQQESMSSEYQKRAEAQPDSAAAQYLYARTVNGRQGTALMEQLAQRFPNEPYILRSVIYGRWLAGDWAGTQKAWEALRSLSQEMAADENMARAEVTALVAQGKRGQALKLLLQLFEAASEKNSDLAELYAEVARAQAGTTPDTLIASLEATASLPDGEKLWEVRARAGLPVEGGADRPSVRFLSTVGRDPRQALKAVSRMKSAELSFVGAQPWTLAYAEASRTGDAGAEKLLSKALFLPPARREVLRRFVRGEAVSLEQAELTPDMRAAAYFVRSRNPALPAEERKSLVAQAQREDWLQGPVTEAITSWTP